jgi:hypothetical protein
MDPAIRISEFIFYFCYCLVKGCKVPKSWRLKNDHVTYGEEVKLPKCPQGARLIRSLQSTYGKVVCNAQGTFGIDVTRPLCKKEPKRQNGGGGYQGNQHRGK